MKILKYQGSNMRQALSQIREELGDNAMVVSTREIRRGLVGKGVEVSVAIEMDEDSGIAPKTSFKQRKTTDSGMGFGLQDSDVERIMAPLRSELRSIRSLMRAGSESKNGDEIRKEMSAMRIALQSMKKAAKNSEKRVSGTKRSLGGLASEHEIASPSVGHLIALVGPSGVGKTTTIAKMAANAVFKDQRSAAIVTLDTYRVGGEEQIRTYANLIGVPLIVVADSRDLAEQLGELDDYEKVYIDTAGCSLRDLPAIRSLRKSFQGIEGLEVHLTLSLTTPVNVIDANYRKYAEVGINRILFTKLDESIDFDELVRTPARLDVPISFVTTGQSVPEDIVSVSEKILLDYAQSNDGLVGVAHVEAA